MFVNQLTRRPYQLTVAAAAPTAAAAGAVAAAAGAPADAGAIRISAVGTRAAVLRGDVRGGAGVVHVIDSVLSPVALSDIKRP